MTKPDALFYYRNLTYNFARWGESVPVNLTFEGQRYHGFLKGGEGPYEVDLVEKIEGGAFKRIEKRNVQIDSLEGVDFLHYHGH